jgi:POT family proton-dependent oligopeptide transporter
MGLGMILLGLGFLFMVGAALQRGGDVADQTVKASILWLLATYFFHTVGELCLSPVGLSMVSRLSPPALTSMLIAAFVILAGLLLIAISRKLFAMMHGRG